MIITTGGWDASFVLGDAKATLLLLLLLEEGAVSAALKVLPIGGTVATGSVCILDTAVTIVGTATVCFWTDAAF